MAAIGRKAKPLRDNRRIAARKYHVGPVSQPVMVWHQFLTTSISASMNIVCGFVCDGETMEGGSGGGFVVEQNGEESATEELREEGGHVGVARFESGGCLVEVDSVAEVMGVAMKGADTYAIGGELEIFVTTGEAGGLAVEDGVVEFHAQVGRKLFQDG